MMALVLVLAFATACGAPNPSDATIAPGVTIADRAIGGLTPAQVRVVLETLAHDMDTPARDASVDPDTKGLVPAIDGVRLDVDATLARIRAAGPSTIVQPVLVVVLPKVTLGDLPAAPIYQGAPSRYSVALVINVAWGEEYLNQMLQTLQTTDTTASFCLVGAWAKVHSADVATMVAVSRSVETPFEFCNHGYRDHGWAHLSESQAYASITHADQVIEQLTGQKPAYFSPHKGEWNQAVLAASRRAGHQMILWSVDTIDWQNPAPATILQRVLRKVGPGSIVLMHPTASTAQALPALIAEIRAKGLRLVTLSQLLSPSGDPLASPESG